MVPIRQLILSALSLIAFFLSPELASAADLALHSAAPPLAAASLSVGEHVALIAGGLLPVVWMLGRSRLPRLT